MRLSSAWPWPEVSIWLVGALLRLSFADNYGNASFNFDFIDHELYIEWFAKHWELPPLTLSRLTYGPPLFHFLGGMGLRLGGTLAFAHWLAIGLGLARLALFAWALRFALPNDRVARLFALSLAAILPCAVHLDGMTNNESLSMVLCWLLLVVWRWMDVSLGRTRWLASGLAGVLVATALLTKFSVILLAILMVGIAVVPWVLESKRASADKLQHTAVWLAPILIATVLAGWYFARNQREYGHLFPTAFEGNDSVAWTQTMRETPLLSRRPPIYFLGWNTSLYVVPHYPSGTGNSSRFFPTLVASSFSAYYLVNFSLQGADPDPQTGSRFTEPTLSLARASMIGGTLLALALVLGLGAGLWTSLATRNWLLLAYVLTPVIAVVGQAYFSLKYPIDHYGVTKGGYLQFAAAPMFAATGVVFSWCWRRTRARPAAILLFVSLLAVASFTIYARATAL